LKYINGGVKVGLLDRMSTVIGAKMNKIIGKMEDPRETLDYSYEKQLELLQNVKRGVADVTTSKKRLELQKAKLQMSMDQSDVQAKDAVKVGRDDLAKMALERKVALQAQAASLDQQIADLTAEQQKLMAAESRLATKVESFRAKKETIKAQYSAAEAQVKVTESVTGISEEMADVGLAVDRAENKTEEMKARSAALDELLESGVLEDYTGGDKVERELAKAKAQTDVEAELARLKAEAGK
jgi:phage shock protein A